MAHQIEKAQQQKVKIRLLLLLLLDSYSRMNVALWRFTAMLFRLIYRNLEYSSSVLFQNFKTQAAFLPEIRDEYTALLSEGGLGFLSQEAANDERLCVYCTKLLVHSSLCSRCKEVRYCGPECQKKDWINHKIYCGETPLKEVAEFQRTKQLPPHLAPPSAAEIAAYVKEHLQEYLDPEWRPYPDEL